MKDIEHLPKYHGVQTLGHREILAAVPGLTYRQLDYWTREGFARTIGERYPDAGVPRQWRADEVLTLRRVLELSDVGVRLDTAFYIARQGTTVQLGDYALLTWVGELA